MTIITTIFDSMAVITIEVGDGSENAPVEIPRVANHNIVRIEFTGSIDTEIFLYLPNNANIGDLFELFSLNNIQINVISIGGSVLGIANASPYRSVLSVRKILDSSETTDLTWLGAKSVR
mgnify:CR=1 FL=1